MSNHIFIAVEKVETKCIKQALPYNFGKDVKQTDHFVLGLRLLASGTYSIVRWYRLTTSDPSKVLEWQDRAIKKINDEIDNGGLKSVYLIGLV